MPAPLTRTPGALFHVAAVQRQHARYEENHHRRLAPLTSEAKMSRKVSRGTRVALTTCSHPTPPNRPRQKYLSRFPGPEFAKREHWSLVRAELPLRVDVRSEAETSFLESLYGEMRRREEEHFAPDDASRPRERRCPSLHGFGLRDFATYEDLTQRLFEYEENLSPA